MNHSEEIFQMALEMIHVNQSFDIAKDINTQILLRKFSNGIGFKGYGLHGVIFYGIISKTSYEMGFYANKGLSKNQLHSEDIIESGDLDSTYIDSLYSDIANSVRESDYFKPEMNNVLIYKKVGDNEVFEIYYFPKSMNNYKIKKEIQSEMNTKL